MGKSSFQACVLSVLYKFHSVKPFLRYDGGKFEKHSFEKNAFKVSSLTTQRSEQLLLTAVYLKRVRIFKNQFATYSRHVKKAIYENFFFDFLSLSHGMNPLILVVVGD